jgi:hypothetical protein
MAWLVQYSDRRDVIASFIAAGAFLDPAAPVTFIPYHTPIAQGTRLVRAVVLAEVATFTGSAGITPPVWGATYRDGSDNVFKDSQLLEWVCTATPGAPETIYGVIIDNGVTVMIDLFATPVTIERAGDAVRHVVTIPFGQ